MNLKMGSFTIKRAQTQNEKEDHIKLRKSVYENTYTLSSSDSIKQSDKFDEYSTYYNVYDKNEAIGTIRCINDNPNGLPIESEAGICCDNFRESGSIVECSRFSIIKDYRKNPLIFMSLIKCIYCHIRENNILFVIIEMAEHLVPLYEKLGFKKFSRPFLHPYGVFVYPGYMDFTNILYRSDSEEIDRVLQELNCNPEQENSFFKKYFSWKMD